MAEHTNRIRGQLGDSHLQIRSDRLPSLPIAPTGLGQIGPHGKPTMKVGGDAHFDGDLKEAEGKEGGKEGGREGGVGLLW